MGRADQQARAGRQAAAGAGVGHAEQAQGVESACSPQHAARAETVGQPAGKGLCRAPHEVLQGQGEGKNLAAPLMLNAHRRQEQAEGVAYAHGNADDQRRIGQYGGKRALRVRCRSIHDVLDASI